MSKKNSPNTAVDPSRIIETTPKTKPTTRYLVVQSKTGRDYNRAGFRFGHKVGTPIDLAELTPLLKPDGSVKMTEEQRYIAITEDIHLAVSFVDQERYELALMNKGGDVEEDATISDPELREQNARLLEENEALRNEISLLKGQLNRPAQNTPASGPIGG